jgi:Tfp pilus assembly protein PilF
LYYSFSDTARAILKLHRTSMSGNLLAAIKGGASVRLQAWLSLILIALGCMGGSPNVANAASSLIRQQETPADERITMLLAEGRAALERGDEAAARTSFEKVLALAPQHADAHTFLGFLDSNSGDIRSAEKHFAAAAIATPFSPSAHNNYGAILLRAGRTQLAAAQFEKSLKLDPNQPSALVNLAQVRFATGKTEDLRAALELFQRALALAPDPEVARASLITALQLDDKGKIASGYRAYAELLRAQQSGTPPTLAARLELGQALLKAGATDEAIEELTEAVKLDSSSVAAIVALGQAFLARGELRAAGRTLESAVARGLDSAPLYAALAEVYEKDGHIENAIPAMRLAIAHDPKNEHYQLRYGLLLTDTKAPAAAVIRLQEAVREFPNSSRMWLALGIAQLNAREYPYDARKSFERALELDPHSVLALSYLGTTYAERGEYDEAVKLYERAIAADESLAVPYYLAADVIIKLPDADLTRAEQYLRRSVQLDPSFAAAFMALARLHVRAKRWAEAAVEFERAVQLSPKSAEAHYQLARVYTQLKRNADAQRELASFRQLKETQEQAAETERRDLVRRLANVRF